MTLEQACDLYDEILARYPQAYVSLGKRPHRYIRLRHHVNDKGRLFYSRDEWLAGWQA